MFLWSIKYNILAWFWLIVTSKAKVSWQSNRHFNEFCRCIQCRYKGDCLYQVYPKLDTDKLGHDWTCPQHFFKSLAFLKCYKSQAQYFPAQNIPPSRCWRFANRISSRGKYSVPIKNMDVWEKRARRLVAINSHADLFSSKGPKCREPRSFTWKQNSKLISDSVEEYERRWAKKEDVEVDILSEWVKSVICSCGHGTKAVIQNHKSINEWRIRMFRPTDMDPRTKGVIRRPRIVSITW